MSAARKTRPSKPKAVKAKTKPTASQEKAARDKAAKAKAAAEKKAAKEKAAKEKAEAKAKAAAEKKAQAAAAKVAKQKAAEEKKAVAAAAKAAKQKAAEEKKALAAAARAEKAARKTTSARKPKAPKNPTPKISSEPLTLESIQSQIREAYLAQTRGAVKERVLLKDLRPRVGVQREDFDQALLAMQRQSRIVLMGLDNPTERTPEVEAAALHIQGNARHLVYFQG